MARSSVIPLKRSQGAVAGVPCEATSSVSLAVPKLAFTINETCASSGMGRTFIFGAIKDGRLTAIRCGGRTLVPEDSLRAFLAALPRVEAQTKTPRDL